MIEILFVVLPDTLLLDLAGPAEAFRMANQQMVLRGQKAAFHLRFIGPRAEVATSVGATLAALEPLPAALPARSWIVLLGQPSGKESALAARVPAAWLETRRWLARHVAPVLDRGDAGVRIITVCAGALLAADAGLLADWRCTTHHQMLDELGRLAPRALVQSNRVFVIDGPVATSAGVTAGIDLALALIAEVCGDAVAAATAQTMVVFQRRGAQDPELSPLLASRGHLHPALHRVQDAVCERPDADWSQAAMAALAHVTPRHLVRLFRKHVDLSPREYVEGVRVAVAERALRAGQPVKHAIADAGIGDPRQWRRIRARRRA